jgi:outer membrane protein OmpA-like peptidoglycan-associated protein
VAVTNIKIVAICKLLDYCLEEMNMKSVSFILLIIALMLLNLSCSRLSQTQKGAAVGATTGGVVGGVIGRKAGNTAVGAILGAAVGGAAGTYIGSYMEQQAEEIEKEIEGAKVERVGEGLDITFDSKFLFDVNKATLKPQTKVNLNKLAEILKKYAETNILIEGHTDSTGSEEYNLELSKRRAQSVANYLVEGAVNESRITIKWYGESQLVATNDTAEGRQANRRVEIAIMANEKLKEIAKANVK